MAHRLPILVASEIRSALCSALSEGAGPISDTSPTGVAHCRRPPSVSRCAGLLGQVCALPAVRLVDLNAARNVKNLVRQLQSQPKDRVKSLSAGASSRTTAAKNPRYLISVSSLNIGRYIEMMIVPMTAPTMMIMIGSMIEVSAEMEASTSSS
jgi:hypothetical protein